MTDYAVLNFLDLQDAVLENRFRDTVQNRLRAKKLINTRYQQLVGLEDWPFRYKLGSFTSTANQGTLAGPADFGAILTLQDNQGNVLSFVPQDLWVNAYAFDTSTGPPEAFTVLGGVVNISPKATGTFVYTGLYRAVPALMQADADIPDLIPAGHRFVLVHGARADMLQDAQDPAWRDEETLWQGGVQAMQRDLLVEAVGGYRSWPSDPTWS